MDFQKLADDLAQIIRNYREDKEGWKVSKKSKDVTVWWKQSPAWNGCLYKAESVVNADVETVFSFIEPTPDGPRVTWDKAIKALQIVHPINKDLSIMRTTTHSAVGGLISPRDFIDIVITVRNDAFTATSAMGIDYPSQPPTSDHVRGKNYPCAITCHEVPGDRNKTRVTSFIQTDLGGMLPKSVVDSALPSNIVDFFTNLKKALKDNGKWKD